MKPIVAFFLNAQDARRALNALERLGATVEGPTPLQQPQAGRQWSLEITPKTGTATSLYPQAPLVDGIIEAILKFNGVTARS